jgi:polysaccharide biosynthesis transport protein
METPEDIGMPVRPVVWKNSARLAPAPAWLDQKGASYTWEQATRVLRKNGRFALAVAGILIAGIATLAFMLKDVYKPTARLEIDPISSGIKTLHEIDEDSSAIDNQDYLETQVQILQSDALAISVIRTLHLDRDPEFVTGRALTSPATPQERAQSRESTGEDSFLQEQFRLADRTPLESAALASFRNRLSVNSVRNSRLIEVSFASHDPRVAQLVTNTLVTQFIDRNYKNRYTSTMEASQWLSTQLNDLRSKVDLANRAVSDYQKKYGLVEADDPDVPQTQLLSDLNHQLSTAQADRIETEAYVHMIDLGRADAVPALRDDPLYQSLLARHADTLAQLAQTRAVYGDANSNVKKLQDASDEISKEIGDERSRAIERVQTSLGAQRAREHMMLDARDNLTREMGDASSHVVAYRVLKNEAAAEEELYDVLQARLEEAGIYAGLGSSNIHIVDLAPQLQRASGPHRQMIITIGAAFSLIVALILAFAKESFDNTVRTPDDLKEGSGLPSLAMIPPIRTLKAGPGSSVFTAIAGGPRYQLDSPLAIPMARSYTQAAEAVHGLRTVLDFSKPGGSACVVLVSSPTEGEGKTTVAANLAMAFAQSGKTCLVDCDLRRSMAANAFGMQPTVGLGQVLAGVAPLQDVLKAVPTAEHLTILPGGPLMPNPGDLIASEQMRAALAVLRNQFKHIVIDSPPVIPFADTRVLALLSDAVVLVARYGITTRRAMTRASELLDEIRAPLAGMVVNGIDPDSADYRYYNYGSSRRQGEYRNPYLQEHSNGGPPPVDPPAGAAKTKSAHA